MKGLDNRDPENPGGRGSARSTFTMAVEKMNALILAELDHFGNGSGMNGPSEGNRMNRKSPALRFFVKRGILTDKKPRRMALIV